MEIRYENLNRTLFLNFTQSDTEKLVNETLELSRRHPEILDKIRADQDAHALAKKEIRIEDAKFNQARKAEHEAFLPDMRDAGIGQSESEQADSELVLQQGRPRLNALVVLIGIMLRGFYGSVTDRESLDRICESSSLQILLGNFNLRLPKRSSLSENLNCVSLRTLEYILQMQLKDAFDLELDDFSKATLDSTVSRADMAFSTDSRLVCESVTSLYNTLERLGEHRVIDFEPGQCAQRWFAQVKKKAAAIAMSPSRNPKNFKQLFRELADSASKLTNKLQPYVCALTEKVAKCDYDNMLANAWRAFKKLVYYAEKSYTAACHSIMQMTERVLGGRKLKAAEKYLGPADPDARVIMKGTRKPILGYHPQLARSGEGLVTYVRADHENLSDAASLIPTLEGVIANTGVIPQSLSTDDGYSSADNLEKAKQLGVDVVSFSGSTGKKLYDEEEWESEQLRNLRNDRSAVESLIYNLKHSYDFDRMKRTGAEAVEAEMTEKILSYNMFRIIRLKQRKLQTEQEAQAKPPNEKRVA
ncbi:MAG: transposase [Lentisphaeria bacterium]|jgi:IS5 family transposase|nr:transposase [Lentisphaeria bacterium]NLZ60190.1 transposase [Lentisphaerota bacterium]